MLVGKREYGTWKDGSSVYKDNKGYYIVAVNVNSLTEPMYKKYLKGWKPLKDAEQLCFIKKRWTVCKSKAKGKGKKARRTRRTRRTTN
jgi:hypothetical protein